MNTLAFVSASLLICISPGPSLMVVIRSALQKGIKSGVFASMGVVLADAVLLGVAFSGLAQILHENPLLFAGLQIAGAGYLIYLGWKALWSLSSSEIDSKEVGHPLGAAVVTTLLNPKIIVFLLAFLPQYLDPTGDLNEQMLLLSVLFLGVVFLVNGFYILGVSWLMNAKALRKAFDFLTSMGLILSGAYSILTLQL